MAADTTYCRLRAWSGMLTLLLLSLSLVRVLPASVRPHVTRARSSRACVTIHEIGAADTALPPSVPTPPPASVPTAVPAPPLGIAIRMALPPAPSATPFGLRAPPRL